MKKGRTRNKLHNGGRSQDGTRSPTNSGDPGGTKVTKTQGRWSPGTQRLKVEIKESSDQGGADDRKAQGKSKQQSVITKGRAEELKRAN